MSPEEIKKLAFITSREYGRRERRRAFRFMLLTSFISGASLASGGIVGPIVLTTIGICNFVKYR